MDLNDLAAFAHVVEQRGFSAAARALRTTKSAVSKRVARLEKVLGVRLIERSTRAFRVTEVGNAVYVEAQAMLAGAEGASAAAAIAAAAPRGSLRVACPPGLLHDVVMDVLPGFLLRYPEIRLALDVSNRFVNLVEERFDLAIRAREQLQDDPTVIVRRLGMTRRILVADPRHLLARSPVDRVADLADGPLLALGNDFGRQRWELIGNDGKEVAIEFEPRFVVGDFVALRGAAIAGVGIALVAEGYCHEAIAAGSLVRVLPRWRSREGIAHLAFPSRRWMLPATGALVDYLVEQLPPRLA